MPISSADVTVALLSVGAVLTLPPALLVDAMVLGGVEHLPQHTPLRQSGTRVGNVIYREGKRPHPWRRPFRWAQMPVLHHLEYHLVAWERWVFRAKLFGGAAAFAAAFVHLGQVFWEH